jgi:aspartyl-tRNA(Asn)/glutamyl-tRNA(Gln) amidotransferase subunit A
VLFRSAFDDAPREIRKVAVLKEIVDGSADEVREAFFMGLERANVEYEIVSLPEAKDTVAIYYLNMFAEFSSTMQKYDGVRYGKNDVIDHSENYFEMVKKFRAKYLGKEVKRRILLGTFITMKEFKDAWYLKALKARSLLKQRVENLFSSYDIILTPTMPSLPWRIGEKQDPIQMYTSDIATSLANLVGIPAGTVPFYYGGKFPIGIQVLGTYGEDNLVLDYMQELETKLK